MRTIEEVRHGWILRLVEKHGTVADLNAALGRTRTDATLTQIKNKAPNTRTGKVRSMGSDLAREIEEKLGMERGTLDHEPKEEASAGNAPELWTAYERADEVRKELVNAILNVGRAPPWLDPSAVKFLVGMTKEAAVSKATASTTERPIERPPEQKKLQTRIASSA